MLIFFFIILKIFFFFFNFEFQVNNFKFDLEIVECKKLEEKNESCKQFKKII